MTQSHQHLIAFLALMFWLLSNWAGPYGHFCFDGQEPSVSIHMDVMGNHLEHQLDEQHQDADIDLTQSALTKPGKIDTGLILLAVLAVLLLVISRTSIVHTYRIVFCQTRLYRHPPLRAPPRHS